jgi:D-alanyl-D-alanine carboxypeptidase/D-alanyl-D-alanine-endopeptidase (penicillin-binding protein 4)
MQAARRSLALFLLLITVLPAAAADKKKESQLDHRIEAILADPEVARAEWGVEAVNLDTGKTIYSLNPDKLFTPASNTKLFTTATALALIGPDYKFHTTIETRGSIDKYGRLVGDLNLIGRGDPNLSGRTLPYSLRTERKLPPLHVLDELADQVVARGIKQIEGDIVADDSYYAYERYGEGWSQDDLVFEWGAPVSALTINDNVMFVSILPGSNAGDKAFINVNPFPEYYSVDNRVLTSPAGTGPRRIYINREPGSRNLTIWGNIPIDDTGASQSLAIEDPADFTARYFSAQLAKRGIALNGKVRAHHTDLASISTFSVTTSASAGGGVDHRPPVVPPPLTLASIDSAPLSQDIKVINKVSQNLHAELMLRLLGREKGTAATIEGGLEVERGFLLQADIRPEEYIFYDGSGLSRQNLVSPHAIVKLLSFASRQPWGQAYIDSFPVGGVDGSLQDRFKDKDMLGRVKAKTGSLTHVNSLSGYVTTMKGEHVVFSILVNNHNLTGRQSIDAIDGIVLAIANDLPAKK